MKLDRRHFLHASTSAVALGGFSNLAAEDIKPKNPYLLGNFGPVREEVTAEKLKVIGSLPKDLNGLYVRNGPNPQFDPKGAYHWFEGDGMLHGVHLCEGQASYRNRYIQTEGWKLEHKEGKQVYSSMLERPDMKKVLVGQNPFKNAANTALVRHAGKCLALYEAGLPHEIHLPDLATVGEYDFAAKLEGPMTAHPKVDPETGELLGFCYTTKNAAYYYHIDAKGVLTDTRKIELKHPVMMHDFAITKKYAIFFDFPQIFSMERAFVGKSPWHFDKDQPSRFGFLPRNSKPDTPVKWFEAKTGFMFHSLNAYEEGDSVVLIGCRYPAFPGALELSDNAKSEALNPVLYCWKFNFQNGKVSEEILDDYTSEMPRINESFIGKSARFGYTASGRRICHGDSQARFHQEIGRKPQVR